MLIKRYRPGLRKGGKSGDVDCFGWDGAFLLSSLMSVLPAVVGVVTISVSVFREVYGEWVWRVMDG